MEHHTGIDCIIIGYNEVDFEVLRENLIKTREYSGAYDRIFRAGSVYFRGKRTNYMNLLNQILKETTGKDHRLNLSELPNLAVAYLKSFLRKRQFSVEIVNFFNNEKDRLAELLAQSPKAVAITTAFYSDPTPITEIVDFIKQYNPYTKIIVGGSYIHHICFCNDIMTQDFIFQRMGSDIYVYETQGELALSLILHELRKAEGQDFSGIPNLIYTLDNKLFHRTKREPENNSLDENSVDWRYFEREFYTPTAVIRTARGCPFKCAFCNFPFFGGRFEATSLPVVEDELKALHASGVKYIQFIDSTFNVPSSRFRDLCRLMIRNKFDFRWSSFFRCADLDDETFDLMRESGCMGVFLGIESGDPTILKNMNKLATVEKLKDGIRKLKERDIITFVSLIVGFPGETEETVRNTVDFMNETAPMYYDLQLYYHGTTTPIHTQAEKYGIRGAGYGWRHNTMDWRKANDLIAYMYKNIKESTIMSEISFGWYAVPYLLGRGISLEKITGFVRIAHEMMIRSLDDTIPDTSDQERELLSLFAESR